MSLPDFYRREISKVLNGQVPSIENIQMNTRACCLLSAMNKSQLLTSQQSKVGVFSISEEELMKMIQLPKTTNAQLYDTLMFLDSVGDLQEYLKQKSCPLPTFDSFFVEMNKKLNLSVTSKSVNTEKRCKKCNMIPFYDFDGDLCDYCKEHQSD